MTYIANTGGTAWSFTTTALIEHLYLPNQPAFLLPARDQGEALNVLGPFEAALVHSAPASLEWHIDVPTTMATSQVGTVSVNYDQARELTMDALKVWKKSASKGTPNKVLANCFSGAFKIATSDWTPEKAVSPVLDQMSLTISSSKDAVGCLRAVSEYDTVRETELKLPKIAPKLNATTLKVVDNWLTPVNQAVNLVKAAVKFHV